MLREPKTGKEERNPSPSGPGQPHISRIVAYIVHFVAILNKSNIIMTTGWVMMNLTQDKFAKKGECA